MPKTSYFSWQKRLIFNRREKSVESFIFLLFCFAPKTARESDTDLRRQVARFHFFPIFLSVTQMDRAASPKSCLIYNHLAAIIATESRSHASIDEIVISRRNLLSHSWFPARCESCVTSCASTRLPIKWWYCLSFVLLGGAQGFDVCERVYFDFLSLSPLSLATLSQFIESSCSVWCAMLTSLPAPVPAAYRHHSVYEHLNHEFAERRAHAVEHTFHRGQAGGPKHQQTVWSRALSTIRLLCKSWLVSCAPASFVRRRWNIDGEVYWQPKCDKRN